MTAIYWWCLGGGFAVSLLLILLGDLLEAAMDALDAFDALDPLSIIGGVTVFGGAGLLLDAYSGLAPTPVAVTAGAVAVVASVALHFGYVKPMKQSENSTAFSQAEYAGRTGEVGTSVPAGGFGEVQIRMGASTTFQTAASYGGEPIPGGTPVVVVEVGADGVLHVAPLSEADASVPNARVRPRLQT